MKTDKDTKKEVLPKQMWVCYRCNLTFEAHSVATLHTTLSGHRICKYDNH